MKITVMIIKDRKILFKASGLSQKDMDSLFEHLPFQAKQDGATLGQFIEWVSWEGGKEK